MSTATTADQAAQRLASPDVDRVVRELGRHVPDRARPHRISRTVAADVALTTARAAPGQLAGLRPAAARSDIEAGAHQATMR